MTFLDALFHVFFPYGVIVFLTVFFHIAPVLFPLEMIFCVLLAVDEEGLVVLEIHTLGSLYGEASGVVSREGGVQSQKNGLAVGTGNDGVYHVALMELGVHQHFVVCLVVFDVFLQACCLGSHGGQGQHAVSAVDVENFRDGSQLMGRVVLGISVDIVVQTVMTVLSSESNLVAEVMLVAALAVNDGSENALLCHVVDHHLITAVYAVLHQHHRHMGPLVGLNDLPALLYAVGAADLTAHIFSGFHRLDGDVQMILPGSAEDHSVHLRHCKNLFIILCGQRTGTACFLDGLGCFLAAILIDIADSCKFHILMMHKNQFQKAHATASETDQT